MNNKYNSYDHLNRLKCVENPKISEIEKKFEDFSIEPDYDFSFTLLKDNTLLPKVNINFTKLIAFYKKNNFTVEDLNADIKLFNEYYISIAKTIDMQKYDSLRDKSAIYYLFYFTIRCFFYVCFHNNFIISKATSNIFKTFFTNFLEIINTVKQYLEYEIENSSMIIDDDIKFNETISKKINNKFYEAFDELKNYKDELRTLIVKCHDILSILLFTVDVYTMEEGEEVSHIDTEMYSLFSTFIMSFSVFHDINDFYNIFDNKMFYNDGISRHLNLRRDFHTFLRNERIKRRKKKEEEKKGNNDINNKNEKTKKIEEQKDKNKIQFEDDINNEEEEDEELDKNNNKIEFTLFDYMWLFNTSAKYDIIHLFNNRKQKSEFLKALNNGHDNHMNVFDLIFNRNKFNLTLHIHRDRLIEDTLNELEKNGQNLQNELKVKFIGEEGVDEGGVRKEFFILLIRQIFDPNYGMFNYNKHTRLYWFNHYSFEAKIKYELIGTILGLAIYNNTILDVKLPISIYKKLLGIKPSLEDLKESDNELYQNLKYILTTDNPNMEQDLDSSFTVVDDKFGEKIIIPLIPGGEEIMINNTNKVEYVDLFVDWYFNKSIEGYYKSFEKGFYKVFNRSLTKILTPEELELILCGTQLLDFHELKLACVYEEFEKDSETIKYFWEILFDFNEDEKKKFLSFVTGCDRAPIDGLSSLPITVTNGGTDLNQLPTAHTCFNNLILPDYKNKEKLKKALLTAINYSEGFGLI